MTDPDRIDLHEVAPAEVGEIDLYQRREKIYTRKIEGFFQRIRLFSGWPLLLGYLLLPWLYWDGRQAVLFDLPERKFDILGLTFWPQDFPMLAFLLIIAAFGLFAVTTFAGRIWCGYTCPQTVWTSIFMWLEQKTEGSRNQRVKLDKAPWSAEKIARKSAKHISWLFVAFVTGFTFVGYFYPIRELAGGLFSLGLDSWPPYWIVFFTLATYINAGWMREQVCKYMCPYARFQSVMFDHDTLIVSYDSGRGEPRGSRKRDADPGELGLGDCIDCELCVQVCPTGIDIRHGLQYECIGCALCVDACDSVMDKMSYPRGLIRYTSERELLGGRTHWLRPRIIGYAAVLMLMIGVFSYTMLTRVPLELTAIRDRNQLFVTSATGAIDNIYTLQLVNMDREMHEFEIGFSGIDGAELIGETVHTLNGGEVRSISLRVRAEPAQLAVPSTEVTFEVQATDNPDLRALTESRFVKPL
ncbi:MAG: cytochrome c oxidase accessory protein CcoG [Halioglobus sp.]|nr:cytochrome c oxidase accessory protein CcoG [Halioglobus sp.]